MLNAHQYKHLKILIHSLVSMFDFQRIGKKVTRFLLPRFKNNVTYFLNIYRKLIAFHPNVKIVQFIIENGL